MNEEGNLPQPPPNESEQSFRKVIWLLAAFAPSVLGVACFRLTKPGPVLFPILMGFNLVLSLVASVEHVRGMKNVGAQFILGLFLVPFFFAFNVFIGLFVGCSGMGGIGR
jgi:hypothetical protein